MRNIIWRWVRSKYPEGMVLPSWMLMVRAALYPLEVFYWHMNKTRGYQWTSDTWVIDGVTYSAEALRWMAKAHGETYRISRSNGGVVDLVRVPEGELQLYAWTPRGYGPRSWFVVAADQAEARFAVESEIALRSSAPKAGEFERLYPDEYDGWGTDAYTLIVAARGVVVSNTNT